MNTILYRSTRGNAPLISSSKALLLGIAPDGGLYVPTHLPHLSMDDLSALLPFSYAQRATKILAPLFPDFTTEELLEDCTKAYVNLPMQIAPLRNELSVLELWHGPTCAFQDMALALLPRLLSRALVKCGESLDALIPVATSGETGKAVLEGFRNVPRTHVHVFYPEKGVSTAQKTQMITQEGDNVSVTAIRGNFDDTQRGVKELFADPDLRDALAQQGKFLTSAHSINWGRLAPQIVYYVSAYCDLVNTGKLRLGELLDIAVPSGNVGNILAAWLAKQMGLPLGKLISASNANNVLSDFLATGTYDCNRPFRTTLSPSMDVLRASNLERLLWFTAGTGRCTRYMEELSQYGTYTVDSDVFDAIRRDFEGDYCSDEACLDRIASTYLRYNDLIDPHTAVALTAAERYLAGNDSTHLLVVSTASPYKFAPTVARALGLPPSKNEEDILYAVAKATDTIPPESLLRVFRLPRRLEEVVDPSEMGTVLLRE